MTKPGAPKKGEKQPDAALDPTTAMESPLSLFNGGTQAPQRLTHDALVPRNIKTQFHEWEKELLGASMVNIHSKVIVLDPFGENPVVMTGSHNLGYKASQKNDAAVGRVSAMARNPPRLGATSAGCAMQRCIACPPYEATPDRPSPRR